MTLQENQAKAHELIKLFLQRFPTEKERVVIFASAAVALRGVDLGRKIDDLDVFVDDEAYKRFGELGLPEVEKSEGVYSRPFELAKDRKGEVLREFPGVAFAEVRNNAEPLHLSEGVLVGALPDLFGWKSTQSFISNGDKKHVDDRATLRQYMAVRG